MQDLFQIAVEGTEARIAEQIHAMVLPMARLPTHGVRAGTIAPGPQPRARLLLQVLENRDVAFVVEFLIGEEDLRLRMIAAENARHLLAQAYEHAAVGLAAIAFAAAAVAADEAEIVDGRRIAECIFEFLDEGRARFRHRRTQITFAADGFVAFPFLRAGADVGSVVHQRL